MRTRGLLGLTLAVLVVASGTAVSRAEQPRPPRAIEVACSPEGTRVIRGVGDARPQGVTVRFRHPAGHWQFFFEGGPGNWTSLGSAAMVSELRLPMPPGPARLTCMPAGDLAADVRDPRWKVDVRVEDPRGLWVSPRPDCTELVGASEVALPRPPHQERESVLYALNHVVRINETDHLARVGYPRQQPRIWGLYRDGALIATAKMMPPSPDGLVSANHAMGCTSAGHL